MIAKLKIEKKHSYIVLGLVLRYARLKAGFSLRDLGDLANISHTLIGNIEKGKTVANSETLKDLFTILQIEYNDSDELIDQFVDIYNRVFMNLYMYRYDRVKDDLAYLIEHEEMYLNSIVIIDYSLLRFLHAVLVDNVSQYLRINMDVLQRVVPLLSPRQQQIKHMIFGIDYYNRGLFYDGYLELSKALKIGDTSLDPFVNYFVIECQVRMFMFMDAQKNAVETVSLLEDHMNYSRAMLLRVYLAYSHMLLKKYDDAIYYLNKVFVYAKEFNHQHMLDRANTVLALIHYYKKEYDTADKILGEIKHDYENTIYLRMFIAHQKNDKKSILQTYDKYLRELYKPHRKRYKYLLDTSLMMYHATSYTEQEFLQTLNSLIDIGMKGHDQELLIYGFDILIEYYANKRMYKKALELSERARQIRSHGFLKL